MKDASGDGGDGKITDYVTFVYLYMVKSWHGTGNIGDIIVHHRCCISSGYRINPEPFVNDGVENTVFKLAIL